MPHWWCKTQSVAEELHFKYIICTYIGKVPNLVTRYQSHETFVHKAIEMREDLKCTFKVFIHGIVSFQIYLIEVCHIS